MTQTDFEVTFPLSRQNQPRRGGAGGYRWLEASSTQDSTRGGQNHASIESQRKAHIWPLGISRVGPVIGGFPDAPQAVGRGPRLS